MQDPWKQFEAWMNDAATLSTPEPNSMAVATVSRAGVPSNRMVLLKGFDERGLTFYTNFDSRKGQELDDTKQAALCLHWPELARQVRVEGSVERVSEEESAAYFASRPRGSQLGAWASQQSTTIPSRTVCTWGCEV